MKELCESCIKRKTLYCPNSNECYSIEDKPQWLGNFQALQKIEILEQENEILKQNAKNVDKVNLEKMIYKTRCEKAIEYIDNSDILDIHHKNSHDLLNILRGK